MAKATKKAKRFGFWSYDLCPYILGGSVSTPVKDGYVRPDGHGGRGFKAIKILRGHRGEAALARLKEIRSRYRAEDKYLKDRFAREAKSLLD